MAGETQIYTVLIYKDGGTWQMDDRTHGLREEPLLFGMEKLLDLFAARIPKASRGFQLRFSDQPFPSHQEELIRKEADACGHWYFSPTYDSRGWLGDNGLERYFSEAPACLFVAGEPLGEITPAEGQNRRA